MGHIQASKRQQNKDFTAKDMHLYTKSWSFTLPKLCFYNTKHTYP